MIKIERKATYYFKSKYHHESKLDMRTFYDMETAKKEFENLTPCYYINKKDYSIIETISLYYTSDFGIKCYYKSIDPNTLMLETNYIKEMEVN